MTKKAEQPARPRTRLAGLPPSHSDGPAHAEPGGTEGHPYGHVDVTPKKYELDMRYAAGRPA